MGVARNHLYRRRWAWTPSGLYRCNIYGIAVAQRPIQPNISFGDAGGSDVANALRYAMSHWPSGVAVLAVKTRDRIEAITINSFISVSLDPPLILVSIGKHA